MLSFLVGDATCEIRSLFVSPRAREIEMLAEAADQSHARANPSQPIRARPRLPLFSPPRLGT